MRNQQRKTCSEPSLRHLVSKHSLAERREYEKNVHQPKRQGREEWIPKMLPELSPEHGKDEIRTEVNDRCVNQYNQLSIRECWHKTEHRTRHQLRHKHRSDIPPQENTDSNKQSRPQPHRVILRCDPRAR